MSGGDPVQIVWLVGCLVLAAGALASRRLAPGRMWKPALAWVAIFLVLVLLAARRAAIIAWFHG